MKLTNPELELLRTYQHSIELKMSIYQPNTILACQVNNPSIAKGARTIPFNTVSSGSYAKVKSGMTLLVGSIPGKGDIGRIRVRSASSTQLIVAENSKIKWVDRLYLTVIDLFDIVAIYPRIIRDPSNNENVIFYKDYDIVYTNQNYYLGTMICMGSHRAVELTDGQPQQLYYTATGSANMDAEVLSYDWSFAGASGVTGSNSAIPGYITYDTPGNYLTTLTISGSGGSMDTSYRYVTVEPDGGTIKTWEITNLSESRSSGGFTADVTIRDNLPFDLVEGSAVIFHTDEWYGDTHQSIGTASQGCEKIFAVGYILKNSIRPGYDSSSMQFTIGSMTEKMKQTNGFAISAESKESPTTWYEIRNLTVKKGIFHFLKFHSTALLTCDLAYTGADQDVQFLDTSRESLYDGVENYLKSTIQGDIVSDRQGKLWIGTDMSAVPAAKTNRPYGMTITKHDWIGTPTITVSEGDTTSYMEVGGIIYHPTQNESIPVLSAAPGAAPSYQGTPTNITGLALSSQTYLNALAGNLFAYKNAKYPLIDMEMRTAFKNMNIAPQETYRIIIEAADTPQDVTIDDIYTVQDINWTYNSVNETLMPTVTFRAVTEGEPGETLIIPVVPSDGFTVPTFDIPPFTIPEFQLPYPGSVGTEIPPTYAGGRLALLLQDYGLWSCYLSGDGLWVNETPTFLTGTGDTDPRNLKDFDLCQADGRAYFATNKIVFSKILGDMADAEVYAAAPTFMNGPLAGGVCTDYWIHSIGCDHRVSNQFMAITSALYALFGFRRMDFWKDNGVGVLTQTLNDAYSLRDNIGNVGNIIYTGGKWYAAIEEYFEARRLFLLGALGNSYTYVNDIVSGPERGWIEPARDVDKLFGPDRYFTTGGTISTTIVPTSTSSIPQVTVPDSSGQSVMMAWQYTYISYDVPYRSFDGGNNWEAIPGFPPLLNFVKGSSRIVNLGNAQDWAWCGNDASDAYKFKVFITADFGDSWEEVTNNLPFVVPAGVSALIMRYA